MPEGVSPEQAPPTEIQKHPAGQESPETLLKKVHELIDQSVPDQEGTSTTAQREHIYDETGDIVDVRFIQNGKIATLKSVLPGRYIIAFAPTPEGYTASACDGIADQQLNKVTVYSSGTPQAEYEEKIKDYFGQNLLAQSLNEGAYHNNPSFLAYINRSGLPFRPHSQFEKADLECRQKLYRLIREEIWNPARFDKDLA